MSIVLLVLAVGVGINLAIGFGLATLFFKDSANRTTAGIVIGVVSMIASAALLYAGCGPAALGLK